MTSATTLWAVRCADRRVPDTVFSSHTAAERAAERRSCGGKKFEVVGPYRLDALVQARELAREGVGGE